MKSLVRTSVFILLFLLSKHSYSQQFIPKVTGSLPPGTANTTFAMNTTGTSGFYSLYGPAFSGTPAAAALLHFYTTSAQAVRIERSGEAASPWFGLSSFTGTRGLRFEISANGGPGTVFPNTVGTYSDQDALFISPGAQVGIGTTTPKVQMQISADPTSSDHPTSSGGDEILLTGRFNFDMNSGRGGTKCSGPGAGFYFADQAVNTDIPPVGPQVTAGAWFKWYSTGNDASLWTPGYVDSVHPTTTPLAGINIMTVGTQSFKWRPTSVWRTGATLPNWPAVGLNNSNPVANFEITTPESHNANDGTTNNGLGQERFFRCDISNKINLMSDETGGEKKDFFEIDNGTTEDLNFEPVLWGHRSGDSLYPSMSLMATTAVKNDVVTTSSPMSLMMFTVRITDSVFPHPDRLAASFGHLSNRNLFQWDNSDMTKMLMDHNGFLGIGLGNAVQPTERLHTRNGIRFQDLPTVPYQDLSPTMYVTVDASGKLHNSPVSSSGTTLSCTTVNSVPRVTGTNTLGCGTMQDNGSSVGVGTTPGGTYTTSSPALTAGGPTISSAIEFNVNGLLQSTTLVVTSDKRYKKDITNITCALSKVNAMQGVTYNWRKDEFNEKNFDNFKQIGFIAQDMEKVVPEAVIKDDKGYYAINYIAIIPVLTEAIKEQQAVIEKKDAEIKDIQANNAEMSNRLAALESRMGSMESCIPCTQPNSTGSLNSTKPSLEQNQPNPFTQATVIRYFVPENVKSASIQVKTLGGTLLDNYTISSRGNGQLNVAAGSLAAGNYIYSLIADGKIIDTKKMTIVKE